MEQTGIILRKVKENSFWLLNPYEGKNLVVFQKTAIEPFVGSVVRCIDSVCLEDLRFIKKYELLDGLYSINYDEIAWMHELFEISLQALCSNQSCHDSFNVLYDSLRLAKQNVPSRFLETVRQASVVSLLSTFGFPINGILNSLIELFKHCQNLLNSDTSWLMIESRLAFFKEYRLVINKNISDFKRINLDR